MEYIRPRRRLYRFLHSATARLSYWCWWKATQLPLTEREQRDQAESWKHFEKEFLDEKDG